MGHLSFLCVFCYPKNHFLLKSNVKALISQPPEIEFRALPVSKKFLGSDGTTKVNDEILWAMPQQFPKSLKKILTANNILF